MKIIILLLMVLLMVLHTFATLIGYIPELNNGPDDCCSHSSQWDDPFTLMCQTCAYDVLGKGITGITYKWYDNNIVQYEITCSSTSRYSVSCSGTNNQNGGHPSYHATCNDDCLLSDAQPFIDLCINSLPPKNSLEKSKNRVFQINSWQSGCEKKKQTLVDCETACNSPQGCCGTTCASNSCSGGGCCAASKSICKQACNVYFSPGKYNIIDINVTNYINETRWINTTRWNNTTRWVNATRWINETRWINTTRWINKTRWINTTRWINKTRWINTTRWIDREKINWINQTRWIDKKKIKWINATRWINKTRFINKTNLNQINETKWNNKSIWIYKNNDTIVIQKIYDLENDNKKNKTGFHIDFNNVLVLGGFTIGGFILFCITFYIAWKCWLREKLEEMLINYCFGNWGEKLMDAMETMGWVEEWREKKEKKQDEEEYYGLTPEQIGVCKEAKLLNKIKYEEALKIRWEEIAKHAIRPNDEYHNKLLDNIKYKEKYTIETEEIENHETVLEMSNIKKTLPGTPRRRKINRAFI